MESKNEDAASTRSRQDDSGAESDSSDEVLFPYPVNGSNNKASNAKASGDETGGTSDSDCDDATFNSSPEASRVRKFTPAGPDASTLENPIQFDSSSDEEDRRASPPPRRRREMTEEAMQARVQADLEIDLLRDMFAGGTGAPQAAAADREFQREMRAKIEQASRIDLSFNPSSTRADSEGQSAKAAAAAAEAARAARSKRALEARRVFLTVVRSKTQRHRFHTQLGKHVRNIEAACRKQVALMSRDEERAELSLFFEGAILASDQTLAESGLRDNATLNLAVKGEAPKFDRDLVTLHVRVDGGKVFKAETTTRTNFAAFIESFIAAVSIPPTRAGACAFEIDGEKLNPKSTPADEDLESGDIIDASFPADVVVGVQASPTELNLVVAPSAPEEHGFPTQGDPIAIKVQVLGGKTFTTETTDEIKFSDFMSSFTAAVGVPLERANECAFEFDGDKLTPEGTPKALDMDSGDLVDAKFPSDLMVGVQASPSQFKLVIVRPVKRKAPSSPRANEEGARRKASPRRSSRNTCSRAGLGSGSSEDVIVLD